MPGDDGVATIRKIRASLESNKKSKIPVLFITGFADEKLEKEARSLNPIAYLLKPFDIKQILELIKSAVGS